jgi:hypothetical protein
VVLHGLGERGGIGSGDQEEQRGEGRHG